ncbi:phosphatidate cytidylyltransferase [Candidatus Sumerlaeota bacterium]|nr:phosphatidate cytidylyltransferase [Candidatus Sumerlaeota bacterium]
MSPNSALHSSIFLTYCALIAGLLLVGAVALALLKWVFKREVRAIWITYRGWLIIIPVVFGFIFCGRAAAIVGIVVLSMLGFKEFARATGLYRDWWMTTAVYLGIAAIGIVLLVPDPRLPRPGWYGLFMALPVYVIALFLAIPVVRNHPKGQLQIVALGIVGFIYFGWMFAHAGWLANSDHAYGYLLYLIFSVELNDVAAFTCGKPFGKRKMRTEISPKKTWAGSIGAFGFSLALPWAMGFSFPHFGPLQKIMAGLIVGVGGQLGDLSISFIKRDLGIKDMGVVIPGHGGILDRIDSLIYTAPLFVHMTRWFYDLQ